MEVSKFISEFEYLSSFPGIKASSTIYAWYETQGSNYGIRALGFRHGNPNGESDELGLNKDGRSCRGVPPSHRPVDNSKRHGLKSLRKSQKRLSIRF